MIATVILAAGGSSRLGQPKQLLNVAGKPLLQVAVDAARRFSESENPAPQRHSVYVVLGANREDICAKMDFTGCHILINADWQSGMASSIKNAIRVISASDSEEAISLYEGVILMIGDQPHVRSQTLTDLVDAARAANLPLAISSFCGAESEQKIVGPPAYFARKFFPELLQLSGDAGARKVTQAHKESTAIVDFPLGAIDIDTEADYAALMKTL